MSSLVLFLAITAALIATAFWLDAKTELDLVTIVALIALGEVAAALVTLIPRSQRASRRCRIHDPYLSPAERGPANLKFDAKVVNSGEVVDVLERIEYSVLRGFTVVTPLSTMVAGIREIAKETGHVLPGTIAPGYTYVVEGIADMLRRDTVPTSAPLAIRCKFTFAHTKPNVVYAEVLNNKPPSSYRRLVYEVVGHFGK